ncbi:hypothetical protein DDE19_22885 [Micromonospora ureilytica]|uniref:Secreted protein n=1 Tax=Micromonospora ureilytica TaxID=709868 RepID=A0A3N9XNI4_9ACTN|nr:hypothetical protein [Micromonospora ureilytica]RQX14546.1 hypothetical protein DDE19_22885 [Micromonospora ureilytica]
MDEVLIFVVFAGCVAAVLGILWWLASRVRRGIGGEVMGPFEEMWHPAAHRFRAEIRVQETRTVPMPPQGGKRNEHGRNADELTSEQAQEGFGPQT